MSTIENLLDSWWHDHEAGRCAAREERDGTKCPFCECRRTGISATDLLEG